MTLEQVKALAELDGWFIEAFEDGLYLRHRRKCVAKGPFRTEAEAWDYGCSVFGLAAPFSSYDAILPLLSRLDKAHLLCFWDDEKKGPDEARQVVPTPAQICEALLREQEKP